MHIKKKQQIDQYLSKPSLNQSSHIPEEVFDNKFKINELRVQNVNGVAQAQQNSTDSAQNNPNKMSSMLDDFELELSRPGMSKPLK